MWWGFLLIPIVLASEQVCHQKTCPKGTYSYRQEGCIPCPYGYACPHDHVSNLHGTFPPSQFIPWVVECPYGMYGVGENNATHLASCHPCVHGYACTRVSKASEITANSTSFPHFSKQEGVVKWTLSCNKGTYPSRFTKNTATSVAKCDPCPYYHACVGSSVSLITGELTSDTKIWVEECPEWTYSVGNNTAWSVAECLPCPEDHGCPGNFFEKKHGIPYADLN